MHRRKLTMALILVILLILPLGWIGCAGNRVILHPIEKTDIVRMEKGKAYTPEKDGYFLSDEYVKEVAQVKVEK